MALFTDKQVGIGLCDECCVRIFSDDKYRLLDDGDALCEECNLDYSIRELDKARRINSHLNRMIEELEEKVKELSSHIKYLERGIDEAIFDLANEDIENPDVVDAIRVEKLVPLLYPQVKKGE